MNFSMFIGVSIIGVLFSLIPKPIRIWCQVVGAGLGGILLLVARLKGGGPEYLIQIGIVLLGGALFGPTLFEGFARSWKAGLAKTENNVGSKAIDDLSAEELEKKGRTLTTTTQESDDRVLHPQQQEVGPKQKQNFEPDHPQVVVKSTAIWNTIAMFILVFIGSSIALGIVRVYLNLSTDFQLQLPLPPITMLLLPTLIAGYFARRKYFAYEIASPDTHVSCPDCKALVARKSTNCWRCGCKLAPIP